jgi:16S rRNA (adenine1518-N6/adenine1519-N6)-dimethyltransferase
MSLRDTRRKFGQNYLSDPAIIFEMGQSIGPKKNNNFLEIGPGMGALTDTINLENINIKAIDIDSKNIEYLSKKYLGPAKFEFINDDILKAPFNISTQIILMFTDWCDHIQDMHFLVQREVAEKITGKVGTKNWGKLSIKLSAFFDTQILFDVPPEAFDIKPKVTSSFIRISPKKTNRLNLSFKKDLYKVVDWSFISRRKNIRNNLKKRSVNWDLLEIDNNLRPEEVCLEDYIKLAEVLKE